MKLAGAFTIFSAVFVAAAPTPQGDEPAAVFGISFTFENGTFTDVFDVPETLSGYPLGKFTSNRPHHRAMPPCRHGLILSKQPATAS